MKKAHFEEIKLDPLVAEGFVNMAIGSFTHFADAPLNCSVSVIRLEDGSTPYHNHEPANQHEMIFVLSGHGILKTDDKEEECGKATSCILHRRSIISWNARAQAS